MKQFLFVVVTVVAMLSSGAAFAPSKTAFSGARVMSTNARPNASQLNMIFGGPKDDGKPGDYVCLVRNWAVFSDSVFCCRSFCSPHSALLLIITGLRLCIHKGTKGVGRASKQLVVSTMWFYEAKIQEGAQGISWKVRRRIDDVGAERHSEIEVIYQSLAIKNRIQ